MFIVLYQGCSFVIWLYIKALFISNMSHPHTQLFTIQTIPPESLELPRRTLFRPPSWREAMEIKYLVQGHNVLILQSLDPNSIPLAFWPPCLHGTALLATLNFRPKFIHQICSMGLVKLTNEHKMTVFNEWIIIWPFSKRSLNRCLRGCFPESPFAP